MDDHSRCVDLILRARRRGSFDSVMQRVHRIEDGLQTEFAAAGLTDGDYYVCDEISDLKPMQAMTDASKRQREEGTLDPEDDTNVEGYVVPSAPVPFAHHDPVDYHDGKLSLPEGVPSLREWGTYKVAFGKYKGVKTYFQIFSEQTDEMMTYRNQYLLPRRKGGSPMLKDLADYVHLMMTQTSYHQLPKIPGTNIIRTK